MAGVKRKALPQQRIAKGGDRKKANLSAYPGIIGSTPRKSSVPKTPAKGQRKLPRTNVSDPR